MCFWPVGSTNSWMRTLYRLCSKAGWLTESGQDLITFCLQYCSPYTFFFFPEIQEIYKVNHRLSENLKKTKTLSINLNDYCVQSEARVFVSWYRSPFNAWFKVGIQLVHQLKSLHPPSYFCFHCFWMIDNSVTGIINKESQLSSVQRIIWPNGAVISLFLQRLLINLSMPINTSRKR